MIYSSDYLIPNVDYCIIHFFVIVMMMILLYDGILTLFVKIL